MRVFVCGRGVIGQQPEAGEKGRKRKLETEHLVDMCQGKEKNKAMEAAVGCVLRLHVMALLETL